MKPERFVARLRDLVIESNEYRAAGLHKPTRFSLDPRDRKLLPWCDEYFVPPEYVLNAGIKVGALTGAQVTRLEQALKHRGLIV